MRIALFGGTFDPPHLGHVRIATAAADRYALDQVLFAPTGRQPLKTAAPCVSFADRLTMVQLVCEADPRFIASDLDAPHPNGTPNYTIETLTALRRLYPDTDLLYIVGADSFLTFRRWLEPDRLLKLAQWIVVSRPGSPPCLSATDLAPLMLSPDQLAHIHLLTGIHEDISSTEVRQRLRTGDPCAAILPPAVAQYIVQRNLYR